jgi:hemoglobin-like flavoprotein
MVAHFTPSSFPLIPTVNAQSSLLCTTAWAKIVSQCVQIDRHTAISGMTAFYNEFYERLQMFDSSGKFDAVLSRHSGGQNKIAAKGAIILRIVNFIVRIQADSKANAILLYMLGKSHSQKAIRPWQYSIFVQTLLNTISSRLGREATSDVMEAWVNLFAYVMQGMLPAAIRDQVVETELNINTSSEFTSGKVANEIRVFEDERAQRKAVTFSSNDQDPNRREEYADVESKCADEATPISTGGAVII